MKPKLGHYHTGELGFYRRERRLAGPSRYCYTLESSCRRLFEDSPTLPDHTGIPHRKCNAICTEAR